MLATVVGDGVGDESYNMAVMSWTPLVRKANSLSWTLAGQKARIPVGRSPKIFVMYRQWQSTWGMEALQRRLTRGPTTKANREPV